MKLRSKRIIGCRNQECADETDNWAEYVGVTYNVGSEEEYWWAVFSGLLDLMCPSRRK